MKVLVKVTKEILIKSAFCEDNVGTNCAISLAIREILPISWTTDSDIIPFSSLEEMNFILGKVFQLTYDRIDKYNKLAIELPEEAKIFIREFDLSDPDKRMKMKPISFEIDVPNEVIDQIGLGQVYKILSESKTLEHVN